MDEIFHSGEKEIQRRTGEEEIANSLSKLVTDTIAKGVINFIEKQPMAVVCSESSHRQVWVSLLIGYPGFTIVPQPNILLFNENIILSTREDVFYRNIHKNSEIGSLFIELSTRRRFRINGKVTRTGSIIKVEVREAYSNCPKYIQRRIIALSEHVERADPYITYGTELTGKQRSWILNADTFFVGSASNTGRLDASHRGGNKGFVKILDDDTLKIPDYKGNSFYNTLGNIFHNPNVGLLFVDFEKGQTLQLTGKAKVVFDEQQENTTSAGRFWLFKTEQWICIANHHKVNCQFVDYSPFNP